jgi:hypothetical protein
MVTALSIAVAALLVMVVFFGTWAFNLRARSSRQAAEIRKLRSAPSEAQSTDGDDTKRLDAAPPSIITEYDDHMDIPAALIGARCKEIIEKFAPTVGLTPVNLLREAIAEGLTGGKPVLQEMLEILEEIRREEAEEMCLPPISSDEKAPRKPS